MELKTIHENLCYKDKRNPDNYADDIESNDKSIECYCDNCFYGRTELALEILRLKSLLHAEIKK